MYLLLIGLVYLVQYAVGINGLGAPYVAPFAPFVKKDMQDAMYRSNFLNMSGKPRSFPNSENGIAKEEKSCR